jgi:hypothetical protein
MLVPLEPPPEACSARLRAWSAVACTLPLAVVAGCAAGGKGGGGGGDVGASGVERKPI